METNPKNSFEEYHNNKKIKNEILSKEYIDILFKNIEKNKDSENDKTNKNNSSKSQNSVDSLHEKLETSESFVFIVSNMYLFTVHMQIQLWCCLS